MYDVAIIGAGVIGCCVAREIAKYELKTIALEKGSDVSVGASKANSGIIHAGYDAIPGTLKARYNTLGGKMFDKLSHELDFPFKRCGSLVLAFSKEEAESLYSLKSRGEANGLTDLRIMLSQELKEMEPNLSDGVYAALYAPSAGITAPYEMTIAFAENAAVNGTLFMFNCEVNNISKRGGIFNISTTCGDIDAKVIVNAAGVYSDEINNMLSESKIKITPRRGEYCLLDNTEQNLVKKIIFQLPSEMGKGILVTPTVDGNILIGPTSVDISNKADVSTTAEGLTEVLSKAAKSVRNIPSNKIITSFAGIRAHAENDDFIISEAADVPGLINLCGIESPGLSSAPAIAAEACQLVIERLNPKERKNFNPIRKSFPRFRNLSNEERKALIKENPDYGMIICRCESVTKGEILAALNSPLKASDIDAVKRRVRAGMGRCQSGFCIMRLIEILAEELGESMMDITKSGLNSNILLKENKL